MTARTALSWKITPPAAPESSGSSPNRSTASSRPATATAPRFAGFPIYPARPRSKSSKGGLQALGLYDQQPTALDGSTELDPAVNVAINGKFGLAAVGAAG